MGTAEQGLSSTVEWPHDHRQDMGARVAPLEGQSWPGTIFKSYPGKSLGGTWHGEEYLSATADVRTCFACGLEVQLGMLSGDI